MMMEEVKKSIEKNLTDKVVSPFWGAFIVSWCVWNWKVIYVTFFVDSELLMQAQHMLKIDYIDDLYNISSWLIGVWQLCHLFILPLLSSYVVVFLLPKLTKFYYRKSLDYDFENKMIFEEKSKKFLQIKDNVLNIEKEVLVKEKEIKEIINEKTNEEKWDEEYNLFKNSIYFEDFDYLKKEYYSGYGMSKDLPPDIKAYCDVNGLITFEPDGVFELTDKGKYYIKKYLQKNVNL